MNSEHFLNWLDAHSSEPDQSYRPSLIMGILNVTSDSFFDGGRYFSVNKAVDRALEMIEQGADLIDVGAESVRPGALPLALDAELSKVVPVIEGIRKYSDSCISIDTYKAKVMQAAVKAGATMINDIDALKNEEALLMAASLKVPVCLMHMQGTPKTMQEAPSYPEGVVREVMRFFNERIAACERAGMDKDRIIIDPGFGFGKTLAHNMKLLAQVKLLQGFSCPILLGVSRKNSIGVVLGKKTDERLVGSLALAVYLNLQGVEMLRVHDVHETYQALRMIEAIYTTIDI